MIEIIREEEWEKDEKKRKSLPKDIRQIGKPDAGDRIYVENQAYQFLHSGNEEEKTAYVLLGRFEEFDKKWYTFVEAAICLEEMKFEGNLPIWSDRTWAYIFKSLSKKHDDMAIVGCAIGLRDSLPEMSVKLEAIHQKNFGGPHQIMLLMDTLEKDEIFYGNYNGRLYKKDGFYIYYDANLPESMKLNVQEPAEEELPAAEMPAEELPVAETPYMEQTNVDLAINETVVKKLKSKNKNKKKRGDNMQREEMRKRYSAEEDMLDLETTNLDAWGESEEPNISGRASVHGGQYRESLKEKEKRPSLLSHVPSVALVAFVCLMGFVSLQNQRKMDQMEEAMNQNSSIVGELDGDTDNVDVEKVPGNVQPEDNKSDNKQSDSKKSTAPESQEKEDEKDTEDTEDATTETDTSEIVAAENPADETVVSETVAPQPVNTNNLTDEAKTSLERGYYIVQRGDSLISICMKIYLTTDMMEQLCAANQIEDKDAIYAGQILTLP